MTQPEQSMLTVEQVAAQLSVHPESVRRYIKRGVLGNKLRAVKLGKEYRITRQDLEQFLASLSRAA